MGFWTRHLPVFVVILLLSETIADKEFWWMGQEGTFGQGSQVGLLPKIMFTLFLMSFSGPRSPRGGCIVTELPASRTRWTSRTRWGFNLWFAAQLGFPLNWVTGYLGRENFHSMFTFTFPDWNIHSVCFHLCMGFPTPVWDWATVKPEEKKDTFDEVAQN